MFFKIAIVFSIVVFSHHLTAQDLTLNQKADGYQGIWYQNQPLDNPYKFKYSGGLGTYCAKHQPFAIYSKKVDKTFFCFGGVKENYHQRFDLAQARIGALETKDALYHMVGYFDHQTGKVSRPTILLDKGTFDAHDNPVISMDDDGHLWIFSTSHGTSRPSYIHRSKKPYDISAFELIRPTFLQEGKEVPLDNFSYFQAWRQPGKGFYCFFTKYNQPAKRTNYFMTSEDGMHWSRLHCLAAIDEGHYQISAVKNGVAGTAFNYHPDGQGLNWRTNLYYMETRNGGTSWEAADGTPLQVPLTTAKNPALIHDFESEGLKIYLKDIRYDEHGHPVILFITSRGYASGPENGPRTWHTARWTGQKWSIFPITTSDNNYDMGSLWMDPVDTWQVIAPSEVGPQPFNPGGEIVLWESTDLGQHWKRRKQLTKGSSFNHTYVRRPVDANPDFWALWADGNGRAPSESRLYFCDRKGKVFQLPQKMKKDLVRPKPARFR